MARIIFLVLSAILFQAVAAINFPSYIKPCKSSGDINKCVAENVNIIKPYLKKGVSQLMLPSLDPLVIQELKVTNPKLEITVKNYNLKGLSDAELKNLNLDLNKDVFNFEVLVPYSESLGDYTIKGTFLVMQLNGAGKLVSNATQVGARVDVKSKKETRDGKEYLKIDDVKVTLKFGGDGYLYFNNLFGDRDDLTKATNLALNENVIDALNEIKDLIESGIATFLKRFFDNFFAKFSLTELFAE